MNRKQFIKNSGVICCAAASNFGLVFKGLEEGNMKAQETSKSLGKDLDERITEGAKSPEWHKADKGRHWIQSMMNHIDQYLDVETRKKLLTACGRSCYINALGVADKSHRTQLDLEQFLQAIEKQGFKVERKDDRTIIYYGWGAKQNPWGLSMKEGFCMCPIFESDTSGVSPSFCDCSTGYVMEGIERYSGKKVHKIEVIESILRGGKDCRFRLEILNC
jgi:hypothetical protein